MPAISEEALRSIESAKRAVAALPVEKAPDLDKNVADLMQQVRLQHEEELNSSLNAARHSAASEMQEELEAKFAITRKELESGFAAKLEAAQEVAAATAKALTEQIEELKAAARAAEERHAKRGEEDAEKARLERAAAVEEVARRLAAEHEETRLASAHLLAEPRVTRTPRSVMSSAP